jgi:hypothetical protein
MVGASAYFQTTSKQLLGGWLMRDPARRAWIAAALGWD